MSRWFPNVYGFFQRPSRPKQSVVDHVIELFVVFTDRGEK